MTHQNPHQARRWLIFAIPGITKPVLVPDMTTIDQDLTEVSTTANLGLVC